MFFYYILDENNYPQGVPIKRVVYSHWYEKGGIVLNPYNIYYFGKSNKGVDLFLLLDSAETNRLIEDNTTLRFLNGQERYAIFNDKNLIPNDLPDVVLKIHRKRGHVIKEGGKFDAMKEWGKIIDNMLVRLDIPKDRTLQDVSRVWVRENDILLLDEYDEVLKRFVWNDA